MPTKLLDWTESPLFAIYFAISESGIKQQTDCKGKVVGVFVDAGVYSVRLEEEVQSVHGSDMYWSSEQAVLIYRPPHIDRRIGAQRGLFTLHQNPTKAYSPPTLQKWVIRGEVCLSIRLLLAKAGIHRALLFPDLEGTARQLGWAYKWGQLA
jgi:FRG domain-containing protein